MTWLPALLIPIVMLLCSNVFMTFAWYGHLKYTDRPLWLVILASWGIAFIEYCFAVPANRWGHVVYSTAQLETMPEMITLTGHPAMAVPSGFGNDKLPTSVQIVGKWGCETDVLRLGALLEEARPWAQHRPT